jgi:hypothetical protein
MATVELVEPKKIPFKLSWQDSPPTQRLLDVMASILAEEYIFTARQNPELFLKYRSDK